MYNVGPLFKEGKLGESEEEEFDSEGNNEEDYGEEEHDDVRIMWHQLMRKDFAGSKVSIMRGLDSINLKGEKKVKTAKIEARCSLKCTLVHQNILPLGLNDRHTKPGQEQAWRERLNGLTDSTSPRTPYRIHPYGGPL